MKRTIIKSLALAVILTQVMACHKDAEITQLGVVDFPATLNSSASTLIMDAANDSSQVVTFNWNAASYGINAPVTYSLQFTLPADTAGSAAWSHAQEFPVGDDLLTASLMGYDINSIAVTGLGLESGVESPIAVRVKAYVDRPAYSNVITLNVNPFVPPVIVEEFPSLWVPGAYQGWDPATAPTIVSVDSSGLYEGYVYIPEGTSSLEFKYTAQPAWEPMAYGDGGSGALIEANFPGGNLSVPQPGYYELSADLNNMTWTATKTTWSIIGDATPGGWSTDTQMNYDEENQVWTVTVNMITGGSFKFRANNAWAIDFGIDADGNLQYADNPLYPYNPNLMNLTVPSDGNYTITLDLHNAGQYTYKLKKN